MLSRTKVKHLRYLEQLEFFGIKLGLDNIRFLLDEADNPQNAWPSIHVAGTNGKGSVVAFLAAIMQSAGYHVGRYTSPHLIRVNERFIVDHTPISDEELDEEIGFFRNIAEKMPHPPTYFEVTTAVAFRWFTRKKVDIAIIETGMGGRLDATNVLLPCVSVITRIAMDHTQYLGDTLEKIAMEKAGILKPDTPAILAAQDTEALTALLQKTNEMNTSVQLEGRDFLCCRDDKTDKLEYISDSLRLKNIQLGLNGTYQAGNASLAIATISELMHQFDRITPENVLSGLAAARWPCRLEHVLDNPPVYIDVAHNVDGITQLVKQLDKYILIFAASSDKNVHAMLKILAPHAEQLVLTCFNGSRAMSLDDLCQIAAPYPHQRAVTVSEAIASAIPLARQDCPLLIAGSVFLAGEARTILVESYGASPLMW